MYIIYLILSLLGIQAPYHTNESKHGEQHYSNSSRVAVDILKNIHSKSESLCLSNGNQSCSGGEVQQTPTAADDYGRGIVSVSDGQTNLITFMPKSTSYRFDANLIKGDIYDHLTKVTGAGVNSGYYDLEANQIVLKDGTRYNAPNGVGNYQIYNHMPVLFTSLVDAQSSLLRGTATSKPINTTSMNGLKNNLNSSNLINVNNQNNTSCADGSSGGLLLRSTLCGGSRSDVPSTDNNKTGGVSNGGGIGGVGATASGADYPQTNMDGDDDTPVNVNNSGNGTMYMGSGANNNDDSNDGITLSNGQSVPLTSNNINNCQNIMFPEPDGSKSGANNLSYSYTYDYYIDLGSCNSFVRPSLDVALNNYAIFPDPYTNDFGNVSNISYEWGYKLNDYIYFDWFGADDDGIGVRNPNSPRWNNNRADCTNGISTDIYNASYADLEAMAMQGPVSNISSNLTQCNTYGGENGENLNSVNSDVTNIFSTVNGNSGPYFNQNFSYWGVNWICYPDSRDQNKNTLHYHVTCVPNISISQQNNDYIYYNIWNQFTGSGHYPYGGLYSIGHKGSNNLGATWPSGDSDGDNNDADDGSGPQVGLSSSDNGDYVGQAIGSYRPFLISGVDFSNPDGVSNSLHITHRRLCSASNPAGVSGDVPNGNCANIMNGVLVARNRGFYNYEQNLLQSFAQSMNQAGWGSATSTLNGSVVNGTAGYPAQDSDGVWRWHLSALTAPSFAPPSGALLNASTQKMNKGDYFVVQGLVPINSDGVTKGSGVWVTDTSGVPSIIGWNNTTINSVNSSNPVTQKNSNGYEYMCSLGTYNGLDTANSALRYSINCTVTKVAPTTDNSGQVATAVKEHGGSVRGYLRVSIMWHNNDDLDLYTNKPDGGLIYYENKQGILQLDMNCNSRGCNRNTSNPAENDLWTDISSIMSGRYAVSAVQANTPRNNPQGSNYGFMAEVADGAGFSRFFASQKFMSRGNSVHCFDYSIQNSYVSQVIPHDCFPSDSNGNPYIYNAAPSGNLITTSTAQNNIKVGDYFSYYVTIPVGAAMGDPLNDGDIATYNTSNIPSYIGFAGSISSQNTDTYSNAYVYKCYLGSYQGYVDDGHSLYNMYCKTSDIPPTTVKSNASSGTLTVVGFGYAQPPAFPNQTVPFVYRVNDAYGNPVAYFFSGSNIITGISVGTRMHVCTSADKGTQYPSTPLGNLCVGAKYISNGPPSGNLITRSTAQSNVNVGDYFKITANVPFLTATGTPNGSDYNIPTDASTVPSYIGWGNQSFTPNNNTFTSNGYTYSCNLGERLGDAGNDFSSYNMYCRMTNVPVTYLGIPECNSANGGCYVMCIYGNFMNISFDLPNYNFPDIYTRWSKTVGPGGSPSTAFNIFSFMFGPNDAFNNNQQDIFVYKFDYITAADYPSLSIYTGHDFDYYMSGWWFHCWIVQSSDPYNSQLWPIFSGPSESDVRNSAAYK